MGEGDRELSVHVDLGEALTTERITPGWGEVITDLTLDASEADRVFIQSAFLVPGADPSALLNQYMSRDLLNFGYICDCIEALLSNEEYLKNADSRRIASGASLLTFRDMGIDPKRWWSVSLFMSQLGLFYKNPNNFVYGADGYSLMQRLKDRKEGRMDIYQARSFANELFVVRSIRPQELPLGNTSHYDSWLASFYATASKATDTPVYGQLSQGIPVFAEAMGMLDETLEILLNERMILGGSDVVVTTERTNLKDLSKRCKITGRFVKQDPTKTYN